MKTIDQMIMVYALLATRQSIIGITFCYLTGIKSVFDGTGWRKGYAFDSYSGSFQLEYLQGHRLS
jgi:hypothetical protein